MAQVLSPRKLPVRKCTGCAEHFPKMELIRVLRTPDNAIVLDTTGKKSGRGAYICKSTECLNKAKKSNALGRAFEMTVPAEVYDTLDKEFEQFDK